MVNLGYTILLAHKGIILEYKIWTKILLTNLQNLPDGIGISPAISYEWVPLYHVEKLLSFPLVPLSFSGKSRFSTNPLIFVGESWPSYS